MLACGTLAPHNYSFDSPPGFTIRIMLDDIKKTLWAAADKLRANMDAAEYKHLVLGLIFLKYVSDSRASS